MPKVKVIQPFAIRETIHEPGTVIEVAEALSIELICTGLAERYEPEPRACVKPDCCRAVKKGSKP